MSDHENLDPQERERLRFIYLAEKERARRKGKAWAAQHEELKRKSLPQTEPAEGSESVDASPSKASSTKGEK